MNDLIINPELELKHYGVLGMKWGRRRANSARAKVAALKKKSNKSPKDQKKLSKETMKATALNAKYKQSSQGIKKGERVSKEAKDANRLKKRSVNSLSNDELQRLTKRAKLETEYAKVKNNNSSAGKKFATKFGDQLIQSTTNALVNQTLNAVGQGINSAAGAAGALVDGKKKRR